MLKRSLFQLRVAIKYLLKEKKNNFQVKLKEILWVKNISYMTMEKHQKNQKI